MVVLMAIVTATTSLTAILIAMAHLVQKGLIVYITLSIIILMWYVLMFII